MWATFWDALQEVGGRKIVIILVILSLVVGWLFTRPVNFGQINGVSVIRQGVVNVGPYPFAVPMLLGQVTQVSGVIWLMLMLLSGGPQFTAMLEKGWRELTFAKAAPRWQILLERFISLNVLYYVLVIGSCLPLAFWLWWKTGVPVTGIFGAALINTFVFASLLSSAALASMASEGGVSLAIAAPISAWIISQLLLNREAMLYDYITSELGRRALDWMYYILPKCAELQTAAATFVRASTLPTSWPLWTTGLFTVAMLLATVRVLERKSF